MELLNPETHWDLLALSPQQAVLLDTPNVVLHLLEVGRVVPRFDVYDNHRLGQLGFFRSLFLLGVHQGFLFGGGFLLLFRLLAEQIEVLVVVFQNVLTQILFFLGLGWLGHGR